MQALDGAFGNIMSLAAAANLPGLRSFLEDNEGLPSDTSDSLIRLVFTGKLSGDTVVTAFMVSLLVQS